MCGGQLVLQESMEASPMSLHPGRFYLLNNQRFAFHTDSLKISDYSVKCSSL